MDSWNICVWIKVSEWTAWACVVETVLGLIRLMSLFYANFVISRHQITHPSFNKSFYLLFQTFKPNCSDLKYSMTYWYSQHTRYGFEPLSFRIPASHYFRYFCLECIIEVESFLNFLNAVLTSYQPPFQSAVIWN